MNQVLSLTSPSVPKRRTVIGAAGVAMPGGGVAAYLWRQPSIQRIEVHLVPRSLPPLRFATPSGAATRLDAWRGRTVLARSVRSSAARTGVDLRTDDAQVLAGGQAVYQARCAACFGHAPQ